MSPDRIPLPLAEPCTSCGSPPGEDHGEECLLIEHQAMLAGNAIAQEMHDTDDCYWCAALRPPVLSSCRCGDCCRQLIIETTLEDAKREPKIKERCNAIYESAALTVSGQRELIGYLLNGPDGACVFLDQMTDLCTIHETRPVICRLFDCDDSDVKPAVPAPPDTRPLT